MRRAVRRERFTPFQVGLIAIVVIVVAVFLAFAKDIPFTQPYQLKAVFENAPPIQKGQAVRSRAWTWARSRGSSLGGDSPAVEVTMKLDDEALPIHEDAEVKVRPRIFFEGNLFIDIRPGTPDSRRPTATRFRLPQTSAPVQIDQVLGTLQTNTRKDLQKLPWATARPSTASRSRARTTTRRRSRARPPPRRSTTRSTTRPTPCATPRSSTRPCWARRPVTSRS